MKAYQIRITLQDLPTVWRRVIVPSHITFRNLHYVIQYVMGWEDIHLYEFWTHDDPMRYTNDQEGVETYEYYLKNAGDSADDRIQYILNTPLRSSADVKIDGIFERTRELSYVYDFGDSWLHQIILEEIISDYEEHFPVCIGAGEASPPEDVGGSHGYMDFLAAWHDPSHPEHEELVAWGKWRGFTAEFDRERANSFLQWKLPLGKSNVDKLVLELTEQVFPVRASMAFSAQVNGDKIGQTHRLKYFLGFLTILKEQGPLKPTAKGNLPAQLVMKLYSQGYDYLEPVPYAKVRKEEDAWFISELHDLARVSGFVRKRNGRIGLTKKGLRAMENPTEVYLFLWRGFLSRYRERYDEGSAVMHPILIGYLIELLNTYGSVEREISFYTDRLLLIDPHLVEEYSSATYAKELFNSGLFYQIVERCLAEFGLAETRSIRKEGQWDEDYLVKKTALFDEVFAVW